MMVELVIVACLGSAQADAVEASPPRCEEFRIPYLDQMNIVQCVWQSQMLAASWSAEHPGWKLRRVSCELPKA